jgi:hypothetical protein
MNLGEYATTVPQFLFCFHFSNGLDESGSLIDKSPAPLQAAICELIITVLSHVEI